jgi:hypothetical protein
MRQAFRLLAWVATLIFGTFFFISMYGLLIVTRRDYRSHHYPELLLTCLEFVFCLFALQWLFRTSKPNSK